MANIWAHFCFMYVIALIPQNNLLFRYYYYHSHFTYADSEFQRG